MTGPQIVVVGGGLAGLAAAEAISRLAPNVQITLLESKRIPGGRAGSYDDLESGDQVDYCQHVAMGCCTNLIDLLHRCQLETYFKRYSDLTFLHPDHPPSRFSPSTLLPAPLHLLPTIRGLRYLTGDQKRQIKRGLWKLMRARAFEMRQLTAAKWLSQAGQSSGAIERFWDVILVSALGEHTEQVSIVAARKVIIDGFAAARGASDVLVPTIPLAQLFGRKLTATLRDRGVNVRTGTAVTQIGREKDVMISTREHHSGTSYDAKSTDCTGAAIRADAVISAVPWHQLARLFDQWPNGKRNELPNLDAITSIPVSPITGVHLWFDQPITELDHAAMVGTVAQWLFRAPFGVKELNQSRHTKQEYYYQVVISASDTIRAMTAVDLIETITSELRHAFPDARSAQLLRHQLVTDPKSVFSSRPDVDAVRPGTATSLDWLFMAGDWVQTDWPSTMESAVISGRRAAQVAVASLRAISASPSPDGVNWVCPGLSPGFLAGRLIRTD